MLLRAILRKKFREEDLRVMESSKSLASSLRVSTNGEVHGNIKLREKFWKLFLIDFRFVCMNMNLKSLKTQLLENFTRNLIYPCTWPSSLTKFSCD